MQQLTSEGQKIVDDLAQRYGVSNEGVLSMLQAIIAGNGTMAQFNHPDFGGSGQWMQGGMTMVGDLFNHGLKAKVDGLCNELSNLWTNQPLFVKPAMSQSQSQGGYGDVSLFVPSSSPGNWWPDKLGVPAATGAQNNIRYAFFPGTRRLAVEIGGHITVYDTQDHQIGGVSQQQGPDATLTFTSQYGLVRVASLPVVSRDGQPAQQAVPTKQERPAQPEPVSNAGMAQEGDVFAKIQRLAELKKNGILSEEEFQSKKTELLSRI